MKSIFATLLCVQCLGIVLSATSNSIVDKGDHVLICSHEPIEIGIVLDSSVSIQKPDFEKSKKFLVKFLSQFHIGPLDARVSIIPFGMGIYTQDAFGLDKYTSIEAVKEAVLKIHHRQGPRTDTGLAIEYMRKYQLSSDKTRPDAEKVCLVITDGNSQKWSLTESEAASARDEGINMFALGIGPSRRVGSKELLRIAGVSKNVIRVSNFDSLDGIIHRLAKKTCIKKEKPTTTPMPQAQSCGEVQPSDIEFFFSPADLGLDGTSWATSFISNVITNEDMQYGFKYGASTGTCPEDAGFNLDAYEFTDDVREHLSLYEKMRLPSLINMNVFDASRGGRSYASKVAVIFVSGGKGKGRGNNLEVKIKELEENGVKVFVANPAGYPAKIAGATALSGRSSRMQSEQFIGMLCP